MSDTLNETIEQVEEQATEEQVVETTETEEQQTDESIQEQDQASVDENHEEHKGGWQKRVDKLTQKVYRLQGELEASRRNQQQQQQQQRKTGKPVRSDYDTDDEYFEDLADYKAEQKFQAFNQQQKQENVRSEFQQSVNSAIEKHPDWHERMDDIRDVNVSPQISEAIMSSDNRADVLYHLACNPNIARQIASMSPVKAAIRIGQIDAQLSSKQTGEHVTKQKKQTSKAPPPINPVAPSGSVNKDPAKMSPDEWAKSQGYLT
jgi:hypothetical protein